MPNNNQTSDNELLLQIVGYNSEAFEQLFNRYSATIYSLIKEIISNPKMSEKVLLNVFSVFLKRIDHYNTESNNIFTYLTLLSRNLALDVIKRLRFAEDIPIYSDDYEIENIIPNLSIEINAISIDDRGVYGEKIKNYKNQLTEVQNLVLSLVYFEGLNEEEIAKRLNVPSSTLRQKLISIMGILHEQYTGRKTNTGLNKEVSDLICLEALGCLSATERMLLNKMRENEPEFLWKELGEYQNLTALLSTTINLLPLTKDFSNDVKEIFSSILKGNEVDYPTVATDLSTLESVPTNNNLNIPETINISAPKPAEEPVKEVLAAQSVSNKFELKFRQAEPNGLDMLKKSPAEKIFEKNTTTIKPEKNISFKDYNVSTPKPKFNVTQPRPEVVKNEISKVQTDLNQKKQEVTTEILNRSHTEIVIDDPSVVIEKPNVLKASPEPQFKSRLTPTSSIDSKEIFKKADPVQKIIPNSELNSKQGFLTESKKTKNPILEKFKKESNIELPQEPVKFNPFAETNEKIVDTKKELNPKKPVETNSENSLIKNENKNPVAPANIEGKISHNKSFEQTSPAVTPKETSKFNEPKKDPAENKVQIQPIKPQEIHTKPVTSVKETLTPVTPQEKPKESVTPIVPKSKNIQPVKSSITNETVEKKPEVVNPEISSAKSQIKPISDSTGLKIRKVNFTENEAASELEKHKEEKPEIVHAPLQPDEPVQPKTNTDINIDEIITKLDQNESESKFEKLEAIRKPKINKVKTLSAAAIFIVIAFTAGFFVLNNSNNPVETAKETRPVTNDNSIQQVSNTTVTQQTDENLVTDNLQEKTEQNLTNEKSEPKVNLPPLPENLSKEESTYFALNEKSSLVDPEIKNANLIAAAKTEKTTPPIEIKKAEDEPAFFVAVEEMPELIGGLKQLQSKIQYPEIASRTNTEGKVIVQAIVDEKGNVESVKTIKGIGSGCDEVAMDAVKNSKFTPGKQRGKNVKVQVTIPIVFKK